MDGSVLRIVRGSGWGANSKGQGDEENPVTGILTENQNSRVITEKGEIRVMRCSLGLWSRELASGSNSVWPVNNFYLPPGGFGIKYIPTL